MTAPKDRIQADIFKALRALKPALCRQYPITYLGVFGSTARGEARPDSDVDVLVDFDYARKRLSMSDFVGLIDTLESHLGHPVDLVTKAGLHPLLKPQILSEVIEIPS